MTAVVAGKKRTFICKFVYLTYDLDLLDGYTRNRQGQPSDNLPANK